MANTFLVFRNKGVQINPTTRRYALQDAGVTFEEAARVYNIGPGHINEYMILTDAQVADYPRDEMGNLLVDTSEIDYAEL